MKRSANLTRPSGESAASVNRSALRAAAANTSSALSKASDCGAVPREPPLITAAGFVGVEIQATTTPPVR